MKAQLVAIAVMVSALCAGATASAQDSNSTTTATPARGNAPATQTFTFTDQLVQGQLPVPDGATVRGGHRGTQINLIRHRSNFVQEMFKSVENL